MTDQYIQSDTSITIGQLDNVGGTSIEVNDTKKQFTIKNVANAFVTNDGTNKTAFADLPSNNVKILFYLLGYSTNSIPIVPSNIELQDETLKNLFDQQQTKMNNLKSTDTDEERAKNVRELIELRNKYEEAKKEFYFYQKISK